MINAEEGKLSRIMSRPDQDQTNNQVGEEKSIEFLNGSGTAEPANSGPEIDNSTAEFISQLNAQIEQEVRKKRSEGAFPPAFERRLKMIFEQLVPPGSGNGRRDFEALLRSSDRAAYFDIDVPTSSQKPGVAKLKKILRMTQAWYLNYLAQQLNNFSTNLMRLLYLFDTRVKKLESSIDMKYKADPRGRLVKPVYPTLDIPEPLVKLLGSLSGRILVADCGDGAIVSKLVHAGLDAYGVDSYGEMLETPVEKALDLRWQNVPEHLGEIADSSLAAVLLQGSIDLISSVDKLYLAMESLRVVSKDAILVIGSIEPKHYRSSDEYKIQRDISPGVPFEMETWKFILGKLGAREISSSQGSNSYLVWAKNGSNSSGDDLQHA